MVIHAADATIAIVNHTLLEVQAVVVGILNYITSAIYWYNRRIIQQILQILLFLVKIPCEYRNTHIFVLGRNRGIVCCGGGLHNLYFGKLRIETPLLDIDCGVVGVALVLNLNLCMALEALEVAMNNKGGTRLIARNKLYPIIGAIKLGYGDLHIGLHTWQYVKVYSKLLAFVANREVTLIDRKSYDNIISLATTEK